MLYRAAMSGLVVMLLACDRGPEPPESEAARRIVSLSPEISSLLTRFGVEDRIVATDMYSHRLALSAASDLGDPCELSASDVLAVRPDLVLALSGSCTSAVADRMQAESFPVVVLDPGDVNDVLAAWLRIGALVGREAESGAALRELTTGISSIAVRRDGRSRTRVAWVLGRAPLVVVGADGLLHEMLELAGAENAFHEGSRRLEVSAETLAERAPELVLDSSGEQLAVPGVVALSPELAALPSLRLLERIKHLHVLLYPERVKPPE